MLDLPAQLELPSDPFLLDDDVLMAFDVLRHLVEGASEPADLVVRSDLHTRAVVPVRDSVDAVIELRQVPRQPRRDRDYPDEGQADAPEAETCIASTRAPQLVERLSNRPRDPELEARTARILGRDHDPVGQHSRPRRRFRSHRRAQRFDFFPIVVGRRVEPAVLAEREWNFLTLPAGRRDTVASRFGRLTSRSPREQPCHCARLSRPASCR